jgi:hypothetical protein
MFGCGNHLDKRPNVSFCKILLLGRCSLLSVNIEIFKTVILPVVLYRCENWSVTLSEERKIRVFENGVLRRIFGFKRDEVNRNGGNYIMRSLIICTAHPIIFVC